MHWVGVDVGGTFPDVVVYDEATGALRVGKSPTTAADPARGLLAALAKVGVALPATGRVVFTPSGEVDAVATVAERDRRSAARHRFEVVADERPAYEGRRGRQRVLRLAPTLGRVLGLAAGDLVELLGRHPAPPRAWVRLDDAVTEGQVPLDALGRRMLGVAADDGVQIRRLAMPPIPGGLVEG
jgi:hypothetical protein